MTEDDIIRMAREADLWLTSPERIEAVKRFAALVAAAEADKFKWEIHSCGPTCERYPCVATRNAVAAEREACALTCEGIAMDEQSDDSVALDCATAIRARGEK